MTAPADNTPISIIRDAYFDAGLLPEGDELNSEQIVTGLRKLTDLVNLWQTQGIKLWLNSDVSITPVDGTSTYTLGPAGTVVMVKPPRIIDAWYADADGIRRPLVPMAWSDYVRLSQLTTEGGTSSYFVNKQQSLTSVFFWPVPDATIALGTLHVQAQLQVTNPISVTETMNFPIEWRIALRWGLADEICTGQPQAIMDRCQQRANTFRTALEDWDVEDVSVTFAPDTRGQTQRSFS